LGCLSNRDNDEKTFELIKSSELVFQAKYWEGVSEEARDLIVKMLNRSQAERISAEEVLKHKWLANYGQDMKSQSQGSMLRRGDKSPKRHKSPRFSTVTLNKSYKD